MTTIYRPYEYIKTCKDYGLNKEQINALLQDKALFDFFFAEVDKWFEPKTIAKRIAGPVLKSWISVETFLADFAQTFEDFLKLEQEGKLLDNQLKIIFDELLTTKKNLTTIITEKGFDTPATTNDELVSIVKEVLNENPTIVQQYKDGKETTIGFFVGQVMKKTWGKVNPQIAQEELKKQLAIL